MNISYLNSNATDYNNEQEHLKNRQITREKRRTPCNNTGTPHPELIPIQTSHLYCNLLTKGRDLASLYRQTARERAIHHHMCHIQVREIEQR